MVTLVGSGGCGKTRLAIQVGADLLEEFLDGVWFVDLAPLNDGSLVTGAIASAVGAKNEQGISTIETLVRSLEGTKTLIILDNCEQVTRACAKRSGSFANRAERAMLATAGSRSVWLVKCSGACRPFPFRTTR